MNITEFLEARIAEDVERINYAPKMSDPYEEGWWPLAEDVRARLLAECHAKRVIIELHRAFGESGELGASAMWHATGAVLKSLAAVHAAHPAYQQDWKQ